jgi:hypothetical protein
MTNLEKIKNLLTLLEGYERKQIHNSESKFQGGFNKTLTQIDVRVREMDSWKEFTVYLVSEVKHTFETHVKGSEESNDGMRILDGGFFDKTIVHDCLAINRISKSGVKNISPADYRFYLDQLVDLLMNQ